MTEETLNEINEVESTQTNGSRQAAQTNGSRQAAQTNVDRKSSKADLKDVYVNTLANPLRLGVHTIGKGEVFKFDSNVLKDEDVKARFEYAKKMGLLVKV